MREQLAAGADLLLLSGYARLPDAVASHSQYERLGVVLVVDRETGRIAAANTTLLTELADIFFAALIDGMSVRDQQAEIMARVQRHYYGQSGAALHTALRRCMDSYETLRD
ncbi:uncharacterized protein DUF3870 [Tamaricihabitans halophyticus]|uniref:Uncharacterized protein DUF3870 n=2 Tax=Tamaricihabitans halophyticus TaxID=1262583 RepID=A0A4R2R0Z4_9PSEU|nr:uncharacterized protein DUF3870 [Tamaricihabitans halophyticus]